MQTWLLELGTGALKLLLNPLSYYFIVYTFVIGWMRVKRERKNFHTRVFDTFLEMKSLFPMGLSLGLVFSAITIVVGVTIPFEAVWIMGIMTLLISFLGKVRLLSPAYTIGLAGFLLVLIEAKLLDFPFLSSEVITRAMFPSLAAIIALLLIGEGLLIMKNGTKYTSPTFIQSKRGYRVGIHEVKRLWIIPLFLLLPEGAIELPFQWWPVFSIGEGSYTLLLVPFAIGFSQKIQGMLPKESVRLQGIQVVVLGIMTAVVAAGSYWIPFLSLVSIAVAMLGREIITMRQRLSERSMPFYFSKQPKGVMILGIIPKSAADKMSLKVGEMIVKINGVQIQTETQFYEAIQRNRAHCKLEVIDVNGQIRFVQRALYEGEHHELGVLFVQDERKWEDVVV